MARSSRANNLKRWNGIPLNIGFSRAMHIEPAIKGSNGHKSVLHNVTWMSICIVFVTIIGKSVRHSSSRFGNLLQLLPLATFGNFWQLMATFATFWQLMTTYCNLWQLLATFCSFRHFFGTYDNYCNIATLQLCNIATLQHWNFSTSLICNFATLQHYSIPTLQHCNIATLQHCNFATL